jgi:hypothetical protein
LTGDLSKETLQLRNEADAIAALLHSIATEGGLIPKDPDDTFGALLVARFKIDRLVEYFRSHRFPTVMAAIVLAGPAMGQTCPPVATGKLLIKITVEGSDALQRR